jgi:hypothetical protein
MDEDLTIVGPEPTAPKRRERRKRFNVETILLMAKYDEDFRETLLTDRDAALEQTGLDLSRGERLLLASISNEQLSRNIDEFRVPGISRRSLASWAKAAAVLLLLSSLTLTDMNCDITSQPVETGANPEDSTGAQQVGIVPDDSTLCEGITPDILDLDDQGLSD